MIHNHRTLDARPYQYIAILKRDTMYLRIALYLSMAVLLVIAYMAFDQNALMDIAALLF